MAHGHSERIEYWTVLRKLLNEIMCTSHPLDLYIRIYIHCNIYLPHVIKKFNNIIQYHISLDCLITTMSSNSLSFSDYSHLSFDMDFVKWILKKPLRIANKWVHIVEIRRAVFARQGTCFEKQLKFHCTRCITLCCTMLEYSDLQDTFWVRRYRLYLGYNCQV